MNKSMYAYLLIGIMSITTILLRFAPFVLLGNKQNGLLKYYGRTLPSAIIAMIVVFCLKDVSFTDLKTVMTTVISIITVIIIQYRKDNTIYSVVGGTLMYILLSNLL